MSTTSPAHNTPKEEKHGPPMSPALVRFFNPLIKFLLSSPFHTRMSTQLMVLSFRGRKSGKSLSIPVGYVRNENKIILFTHSTWRHNFRQPAPVRMLIQRKTVHGTARLVSEPEQIKNLVQILNTAHGESMSRRMGLWVENLGSVSPQEVLAATHGTYFLEVEL